MNKESLELAKRISLEVWMKYDDTYGYRSEKTSAVLNASTDNPDNIWFFWQQFDGENQLEFAQRVSEACCATASGSAPLLDWCAEQLRRSLDPFANNLEGAQNE